jgi:hypothetical protein
MSSGCNSIKLKIVNHNNPDDEDRSTSCTGVQQVSQGCMMDEVDLELLKVKRYFSDFLWILAGIQY